MPRSFAELIEGCTYLLDWRIGGVQKEYRAMVEKKSEETGTVYLRLFVEPSRLVRMVCYRALIDAPAEAADHTWFGGFTLKVDRAPIGVEPHTYDEFAAFYAASAATDRRLGP